MKHVEIIPLEVIIRNASAGSFSKRLNIEEGRELLQPALELCYKDDALGDPLISDYDAIALEKVTRKEIDQITEYAFQINEILKEELARVDIKLVDFKIEFGRYEGGIILADEISPDTCRLWDARTNKKLDKDRFRHDLGNVEAAYEEVYERLGL